jgi:catechol 2,3-dioxygenase-like lactoylglutathione lyase family enzyme
MCSPDWLSTSLAVHPMNRQFEGESDMKRNVRWYGAVLGARRLAERDHRRPDGTLFAAVLDVPGVGTHLELRLAPATTHVLEGYDFLTPAVEDRAALDHWIRHLDLLGIAPPPHRMT